MTDTILGCYFALPKAFQKVIDPSPKVIDPNPKVIG
jgi:hypothetical protein